MSIQLILLVGETPTHLIHFLSNDEILKENPTHHKRLETWVPQKFKE